MDKTSATAPGLIASLANLARNSMGLVVSRIELAALELSEVRNHALDLVLVFALALVGACFALAFASALVVVLAWERMGWRILLVLCLLYLALAYALVRRARAMLAEGKLALPATMNELKNDRDMLL